ncbi:hypothetical protein PG984_006193 [Apiospora sp. TS-2023a]
MTSFVGVISLYSEPGCREAIVENFTIPDACTTLNETATSVKYTSFETDGFLIWGLMAYSDSDCRGLVTSLLPPMCGTTNSAKIKSVRMQYATPF